MVRAHCITVGISMSSIVSDDSDPFLIVIELTLQLDYKADNLAALRIKLNA